MAVAYLLNRHGESLASDYVEHEVVESCRAAMDHHRCSERLGYEPLDDSEFSQIRRAYEDAIRRHGKPFKTQYGWAAEVLGLPCPGMRDIEQAAGIDHLALTP